MAYGTQRFNVTFTRLSNNPMSQFNPIDPNDSYFFKLYSNIVFQSIPPYQYMSYLLFIERDQFLANLNLRSSKLELRLASIVQK
jgi:hypothetical protein